MFRKQRILLLLGAVALGASCTILAGCHSVLDGQLSPEGPSPAAFKPTDVPVVRAQAFFKQEQPAAVVIGPRYRIDWSIESTGNPAHANMSGRDVVGPDGSLTPGPYGSVRVAGLSPNQAAAAIQTQVRQYLKDPKVRIRVLRPETEVVDAPPPGMTEWSSEQRDSRIAATDSVRTSGGDSVRLVSSGPNLTLTTDIPAGKDALPGLNVPKAGGDVPRGEKIKTPPAKVEETAQGAVYDGMPPGHFDSHEAPHEGKMITMPPYRIGPPDILQIDSLKGLVTQEVRGPHLVRPDGTVGLGAYGSAYVAGLTIDESRDAIARVIHAALDPAKVSLKDVREGMSVDVIAFNSKVYYVISDLAGNGDQVTRLPITGSERVLDALSQNFVRPGLNGLAPVASKTHIWVARPGPEGHEQVLPVDWLAITRKGSTTTNWQLLPGDRVYVKADTLRRVNTIVDKFLSPVERILGVTLLGSQTVNSIKTGTVP